MFIIGITGGTGSGKTTALHVLKSLGALTLNCDDVYHELLSGNKALVSELGERFDGVLRNGAIDRKRLGEIVFSDPLSLQELNTITHRYVSAQIERQIAESVASGGKITAIDAIALLESGAAKKCDTVVGFIAPIDFRISVIMKRDGISRKQALMRINAQKPDSYYKENCDFILENKYDSPTKFEEKCSEFFKWLLQAHGVKL